MLASSLAKALGLNASHITHFAETASHRYKFFVIDKRGGGGRAIYHPAKQLKAVQRWLQEHIIAPLPVHQSAAAYQSGMNIADHARRHVSSRYLLRLDFRNFFESITAADIEAYIEASRARFPEGWDEIDTLQFTQLVCREGRLTIGAVTSPGLSNAICWRLDASLSEFAAGAGITYSRYADDLFFSTTTPNVLGDLVPFVRDTLKSLAFPSSLQLNEDKTRHSSMKRRRRITGLILTNDGKVSLGRTFKRAVRSQVHRLEELVNPAERNKLAGLLAYIKDVEPDFYNRLVLRYGVKVSEATRPI